MNRNTFLMFVAILVNLTGYAELKLDPQYRKAVESGALTRIDAHVVDDEGTPVRDAEVKAVFAFQDGERSGSYVSDSNGVAVVEGITTGHYVELNLSKEGYYDSKVKYRYLRLAENRPVKDGRWQPWGKEERIVLRKVRNPTKLVYPRDQCFDSDLNVTNENIGYDMEIGDWIHPFGKGMVADFYVMFLSDGGTPMTSKYSVLQISFPKPNGAAYIQNLQEQSEFKGVYEAETNRFADLSVSLENRRVDNSHYRRRQLGDKDILVIRSRCIVDEYGKIVSANYSSLNYFTFSTSYNSPGCCRLSYYFNPTPNDTNLEPIK